MRRPCLVSPQPTLGFGSSSWNLGRTALQPYRARGRNTPRPKQETTLRPCDTEGVTKPEPRDGADRCALRRGGSAGGSVRVRSPLPSSTPCSDCKLNAFTFAHPHQEGRPPSARAHTLSRGKTGLLQSSFLTKKQCFYKFSQNKILKKNYQKPLFDSEYSVGTSNTHYESGIILSWFQTFLITASFQKEIINLPIGQSLGDYWIQKVVPKMFFSYVVYIGTSK